MSLLFIAQFEHVRLHVLQLRGRPALLAHEVGAAAGCLNGGQSFLRSVRREWAELLHEDDDVAEVTGAELDAIRREVPMLGEAQAALVLFPSGVEKTLSRSTARFALPLLGFLHAEVFSRVGTLYRKSTPTAPPVDDSVVDALANEPTANDDDTSMADALAMARWNLRDRTAKYLALRMFAALVLRLEEDHAEYINLERQALEVLLGRRVELLTPPPAPAGPRHTNHATT